MDNNIFIKEFEFLNSIKIIKDIKIQNNKLLFFYHSFFTIFSYIFFVVVGISIYLYLCKIDPNYEKEELILWIPFSVLCYWIYFYFIPTYKVIDFDENCIYQKIFSYKFNIIRINEIQNVCNNCKIGMSSNVSKTGYCEGKRIKVNPATNKYQLYYLSFLLKNGEIIDFIELGMFKDDYQDTILLAKKISKLWDIPLEICDDDKALLSERTDYGYRLIRKSLIS